jgi:hypothetical protein
MGAALIAAPVVELNCFEKSFAAFPFGRLRPRAGYRTARLFDSSGAPNAIRIPHPEHRPPCLIRESGVDFARGLRVAST